MKKPYFCFILSLFILFCLQLSSRAIAAQTENSLKAEKLLEEGSLAFRNNDAEKAIALLEESTWFNPEYAEAYYRLGVIYASQKKFAIARDYFLKTVKINSAYAAAYINLGGTYGELKDYDAALEAFFRALELDKGNPKIYYNIGLIYSLKKQQSLAEDYFLKAEQLSTKHK